MMRFRVCAWLSALVVLAGCAASNVEESISKAPEEMLIEQSCNVSGILETHAITNINFNYFNNIEIPYPVIISEDGSKLILRYFGGRMKSPCGYIISFPESSAMSVSRNLVPVRISGTPDVGPVFDSNAVPKTEISAINDAEKACFSLGDGARERYGSTTMYYDENDGRLTGNGQFIGCTRLVWQNSMAVYVENNNNRYRIALIMDALVVTLEN